MTFVNAESPPTAVDRAAAARGFRRRGIVALICLVLLGWLSISYAPNMPIDEWSLSEFPIDMEQQFKYGSIGSDVENGLPLDILNVLPALFPEYLPKDTPHDLSAFGFLSEADRDQPIGFTKRRRLLDLTGLNCAACHTGLVREHPDDPGKIVVGMPSNTLDIGAFFRFLFLAASDDRFAVDFVLPAIKKSQDLNPVDEFLLRAAIPAMKAGLMAQRQRVWPLVRPSHPEFGPGRVDTFNPIKLDLFPAAYPNGLSNAETIGTNEFPAIWNQESRHNMASHWDGNNSSVDERNVSAAMGAGATRDNVDLPRVKNIMAWLMRLQAPKYPFEIDEAAAKRGGKTYKAYCSACHSFDGASIGKVVPIAEIGTDANRLNSYTEKLASLQRGFNRKADGSTYEWSLENFRKTDGYANQPLDGIWARAPYLHNGAVPTMMALLQDESMRPQRFYRGHGVFDKQALGVKTDVAEAGGRPAFLFDTSVRGNGNQGHSGAAYGTALSNAEKRDLIEFLKTL